MSHFRRWASVRPRWQLALIGCGSLWVIAGCGLIVAAVTVAIVNPPSDRDHGADSTPVAGLAAPATPTKQPRATKTPKPAPTSTPAPTPTLTAEQAKAAYRHDVDVREIDKNVDAYKGQQLYYEGEVLKILQDAKSTTIQLQVQHPGGNDSDRTTILYSFADGHAGDGIYEGDTVGIWGRPQKRYTFKNAFGGSVSQPLLYGDYIEKLKLATPST